MGEKKKTRKIGRFGFALCARAVYAVTLIIATRSFSRAFRDDFFYLRESN